MKELMKIHNLNLNDKEMEYVENIINKNQKKTKPILNIKGLLFGFFYLLYKKIYMEALAVIIISLLILQIGFILHSFVFLGIGILTPNLLVGFFFYFMYANKLERDIENCGKPIDKECLKEKGGNSIGMLIFSIFTILFLFWPVIYGKITEQDITTNQNKYIDKVEKAFK